MTPPELFAHLAQVRLALSTALDLANLEIEIENAISTLDDPEEGSLEDAQLSVLYVIENTISDIGTALDNWEDELKSLSVFTE